MPLEHPRRCGSCGETTTDWYIVKGKPDGVCRPCRRKIQLKYEQNYEDRVRDRRRNWQRAARLAKITYLGRPMTEEDFEYELGRTLGRCPICQLPFAERPDVDHDHDTGWFRGLLCRRCNVRLHASAQIDWYKAAIRYLERAG